MRLEQNKNWNRFCVDKSISYALFQLFQQKTGKRKMEKIGRARLRHSVQNTIKFIAKPQKRVEHMEQSKSKGLPLSYIIL